MKEYGFAENTDFVTVHKNIIRADGSIMPQTQCDHQLTIDMAKELCMIQRTEKGKQCRQYFLELEKAWNTPEMVIGRALQIAKKQIDSLKMENNMLTTTVAVQEQQISELKPKESYYDVVLNCPGLLAVSVIAKDYGKSAIINMLSVDTPALRQAQFRLLTARNTQRCIHTGHKKGDCSYTIP